MGNFRGGRRGCGGVESRVVGRRWEMRVEGVGFFRFCRRSLRLFEA